MVDDRRLLIIVIIIMYHPLCRPLYIIELTRLPGPVKRYQEDDSYPQSYGQSKYYSFHSLPRRSKLRLLQLRRLRCPIQVLFIAPAGHEVAEEWNFPQPSENSMT